MSIIKDTFFGGAEKKAAKARVKGINAGIDELRGREGQTREDLEGVVGSGDRARTLNERLLGLLGADEQQSAFDDFLESPGQAFLRKRGERSVLRNASATGGLRGGNVLKALTEFGIGTAATQQGELQDRLERMSGQGLAGVLGQVSAGEGNSANIAELLAGAGKAKAKGITGRASGIRGGLSRIAGAFI